MTVPPGDGRAIEALARYCLRTPVSLTRLCLTADSSTVEYLAGGGNDDAPGETLDALEFLALSTGQKDRTLLVAARDELEEEIGCGPLDGQVADLVDDQESRLAEELQPPSRTAKEVIGTD